MLALALIVTATVLQAGLYGCSRGMLHFLEVAGSDDLKYVPWQDHFLVRSDVSYQQAFVMATANAYGRDLKFEPSDAANDGQQADAEEQDALADTVRVRLQEMVVPRVASISVTGIRQSQAPSTYSVLFATEKRLPLFLQFSDPTGKFKRCLSWGAITESELSIPPRFGTLKMSMIFADFVVGPPYMRKQELPMVSAAEDATWTTFEAFSKKFCLDLPCCEKRCLDLCNPCRVFAVCKSTLVVLYDCIMILWAQVLV